MNDPITKACRADLQPSWTPRRILAAVFMCLLLCAFIGFSVGVIVEELSK